MRFDYCKANLHTACEEHKYDHCEMCNMARAYQHGYETAQEDTSKNDWILCSERLPSEDGRYLATYPLMSGRNWISIKWFGKPNMPNRPIKGKCFYESDSEYGDVIWDNVIAWMPLPKPYREDSEA